MSTVINKNELFVEFAHVSLKLLKLFFTGLFFAFEPNGIDHFVGQGLIFVSHFFPLFLKALTELDYILFRK